MTSVARSAAVALRTTTSIGSGGEASGCSGLAEVIVVRRRPPSVRRGESRNSPSGGFEDADHLRLAERLARPRHHAAAGQGAHNAALRKARRVKLAHGRDDVLLALVGLEAHAVGREPEA